MTRRRRSWVVGAATAAIVVAANSSQGAYFSQSWGWVALAFLVPTTVLLLLERATTPGRLRVAFASLVSGLVAWVALSSVWSLSSAASLREVERDLVYLAVALAVAVVLRRGDGPGVLGGVVLGTGIVSAYALATRLLPDRLTEYDDPFGGYRLSEPVGYWNALGVLATIGIVVAVGVVAHARRARLAAVAAAPVPVLAATLYFTFSRGAWVALGIGLVATIALDPRRVRFIVAGLALAVPAAAGVSYASRQDALTTEDSPLAAATREGHRTFVVVVCAIAGSIAATLVARGLARAVPVSASWRQRANAGLAGLALAAIVAIVVAAGGPTAGWSKLQDRFEADPAAAADLNGRLFSFSGNGRAEQLRVAWNAARERPVAGHGSGTFEYLWYERRPDQLVVRDGHSLYMETLAELGAVGLILLVGALGCLVLAGVVGRRSPMAVSGTAALVAWAAASAFDWHWEMVGVTMTAFLAAAPGLLASERRRPRALASIVRGGLVAVGILASLAAVWSLVGNQALFAGKDKLERRDWEGARDDARRARALLRWSYEPDLVLGDAEAGLGDRAGAVRAYRDAIGKDSRNWVAWLRLAQVSTGSQRVETYARVHELNPRETGLPDGR